MENVVIRNPDQNFWNSRSVLVSGHNGFKGSWLVTWLNLLGADVTGFGLPNPPSSLLYSALESSLQVDSNYFDICEADKVSNLVSSCDPEIVFHLAAQPLVRESVRNPIDTYRTNVMGTINLLNELKKCTRLRSIIIVTTDKVYDLKSSTGKSFLQEDSRLGGIDPYSSSKACVELLSYSFYETYFKAAEISVGTARAGNVIGGGDWAADRLLPDAMRAWSCGSTLKLRKPNAVRPWQHVLESLNNYLCLAEYLFKADSVFDSFNFGPNKSDCETVQSVVKLAQSIWGQSSVEIANDPAASIESNILMLDNSKSKDILKSFPRWDLNESIEATINWYKGFFRGVDAYHLCHNDIISFTSKSS